MASRLAVPALIQGTRPVASACAAPVSQWACLSATRSLFDRKYAKRKDVDTKSLPFLVHRTPSGNLPVYMHLTAKGSRVTRVRKVFGDAEHLAGEVGRLCGAVGRVKSNPGRKAVEVPGEHEEKVKEWLRSLGL
eukprot:gnl/TRDRNA2_/TRDRNA2_130786_c1_seq3.p1 gnl/TRDRNA2_/TRDRNA2_130786_c1~~gnl/TRDRNA2_/TRDRNA2_130786_c1_seq3.p1  ORF type:complete len:134 (+),score=21.63 gnl/TRDRNA2_/TRDRNA2_130786_c1_seq3:172-573(+)